MGYMGFGMRKEVYTRKPKTSFSKMKKIYGDHMEDFHKSRKPGNSWSEKDKEEFKKMVTEKIRKHNMAEGVYNFVIYVAIAMIVGVAVYLGLR